MTCDDVCGSTYSAMQVLYRCFTMTEKVKSASCRTWPGKEVQPMTQVSDRIAAPRPAGAAGPPPGISPLALAAIIAYLLNAPSPASLAAYWALPRKGQAGRALQDQGLTVTLKVSEDLESFEATTDIEVTSPAHPRLGTIPLSDDAALDWHLNWRAAFGGDPAALIDVITPILRSRHAERFCG